MESNWASEHLLVIRTLMERAAVYRRALAPMMLLSGVVGSAAAAAGLGLGIDSPRGFIGYWLAVSVVPLVGSFLLVRREALREREPVWSPPTRRVAQAVLPALTAGLLVTLVILVKVGDADVPLGNVLGMAWLPLGWVILYGCAIHAAGFFMPRGIKLFGWIFIVGGCGLFAAGIPDLPRITFAHGVMGLFFGALHLAYGIYLYFTENKKQAA
jgi:hypothetical protein